MFGCCSECFSACQGLPSQRSITRVSKRPVPLTPGCPDLRLAVISPFLDRHHGTERCLIEQVERLAAGHDVHVHLYCQRISDLAGVVSISAALPSSRIVWHRVPAIPGPHLFAYVWWFCANHIQRWWDYRIRNLKFDLLYSPGINALDADVIAVHIVFEEFYSQVRPLLKFRDTPFPSWPRLAHRRLYYGLIRALERRVYRRPGNRLAAVSGLVASQLHRLFGRQDADTIRNGVDTDFFCPSTRLSRRANARGRFALGLDEFTLLFIGNDWKKKGLITVLAALAACGELPMKLLVVGDDDRRTYAQNIQGLAIEDKVCFLPKSSDVLQFYAAADICVAPSLEDAFGLPVLEAMACGLPVISSPRAGVSEIIKHQSDGFVLRDPGDSRELAALLRLLYSNTELCRKIGEQARAAAIRNGWDANVDQLWALLETTAEQKKKHLTTRST
jgi:glycosyltransferase involved in cell wall biosynthesis